MNKYIQKLELNVIINKLTEYCIIAKTKQVASSIMPSNDLDTIKTTLKEVDEALQIIYRISRAPILMHEDYIYPIRIAQKGGILNGIELYQTIKLYNTIDANKKFLDNLKKENINVSFFENRVNKLYINDFLYNNLKRSIDEDGSILDTATPSLGDIRRRIKNIDNSIKTKLQEILAKDASKLSQTTISMRDGHYVIPVKVEYKNMIRGNILDVSGSQQTVFIEPFVVVELNSKKQELINLEKLEIEKILRFLSKDIQLESENLLESFQEIIAIDLVFAKAMLAKEQNASIVEVNNQNILNLVDARHPLLKVKKVIPNNLSFDNYLGIVITGPNTGGKTVLLKTVGLLVLMVKCGLLIPASQKSNIMIYDNVFCDIGDDQSITENLSTFSGHMSNIVNIINNVTPNCLVLFDEIGGGTDPTEGSNLAIAILDYLVRNNVAFITTTHYSELKSFAFNSSKIVNASMEFDQNTLSPTYRLKLGIPGSSNAFQICRRLNLLDEIIDDALSRTKEKDNDVALMIKKLEDLSLNYEKKLLELENQKLILQKEEKEYQKLISNVEKQKTDILNKAQNDANKQLEKIKSEALSVLNDIKERNNQSVKLHEAIALQKAIKDINVDIIKPKNKVIKPNNQNINVGDDVYVSLYNQYGSVVRKLKDNQYSVSIGNIILTLDKEDLSLIDNKEKVPREKVTTIKSTKKTNISLRLDLRGDRYDEAKDKIEKYFDDCMLSGIKQFTIIHGYGTGTIRTLVREFLKNNKEVKEYRYGVAGEGGMGVTVVTLK